MPCDERFVWDGGNLWKVEERFDHEEVQEVFDDPHRISGLSHRGEYRGETERRYAIIGETATGRVLFVGYVRREGRIRVFTARHADPDEQRAYWNRRRQRR